MTPMMFMLAAFLVALGAGLFGSLLGLGGGLIVVPALTLLLMVDIRYAIGASIISVIATSSGAGVAYVRERMTNIRLAMFLELATTLGALGGALLAGMIDVRWLYATFGLAMMYAALAMWRFRPHSTTLPTPTDTLADTLQLHGSFYDQAIQKTVDYRVTRTGLGFALSLIAGALSGLLGVGGGIIKVPAMTLGMRIPLKVATTTSNFMIGVTAAASAGIYFSRGDIDPFIAAPIAVGVLIGSTLGAKIAGRIRAAHLRTAFTLVLIIVALQMIRKGLM